jgi:hypothetical protein
VAAVVVAFSAREADAGERRGEDSRLRRVNMPEGSMGALCCQGILLMVYRSNEMRRDTTTTSGNWRVSRLFAGCRMN